MFYRRTFSGHRFQIALWALGIFILTYSFVQFLVILLQCNPVRGAWDATDVKATCVDLVLEFEVMGVLNAITDVITVCLPLPMLWGLQLPPKQQCQVVATILVGGFVCVVSILRVPMEARISSVDKSCKLIYKCRL